MRSTVPKPPKATFERDGNVGIITISDPPLNLFSLELIADLTVATREAADSDIRALLLRSDGEHFTAGAKADEVFGNLTAAEGEQRIQGFLELAQLTERLAFPTLGAVRGLCLAAGLETIVTLDLIWASETAQFAFAEPVIGLTPIIGGVYRLAARAGSGRAIEAVLAGRPYTAATFAEWGVINRVLPDAELDEKSLAFAHKLAAGPTRAYDVTRQLLLAYRTDGIAAADALTAKACAPLFETDDLTDGIASLLANGPGKAVFHGR
jgi:enoyl-CoA hydratase/carnithine racemase